MSAIKRVIFKRDCPDRKRKAQFKLKERGEAVVASKNFDSAEVLAISDQETSKEWILDSGWSFHMCPNKSWFEALTEEDEGLVLLGNNKSCKTKGMGSIRIRMFDGADRVIKQVRYIPELKRNLISLGVLDATGYFLKSENGSLIVCKRH